MSRKKSFPPRKFTGYHLPPEMADEFAAVAYDRRLPASHLLVEVLQHFLDANRLKSLPQS